MEKQIVVNIIQTPDGTILQSHHTHDYKSYMDSNGEVYQCDGGIMYLKRSVNVKPYVDMSLNFDDDYELIRKYHCRGGRGVNGDAELKYVPLESMSNQWLLACVEYNKERRLEQSVTNELYLKELKYREDNNITILDK